MLVSGMDSLKGFQFQVENPVFWAMMLVLFLFLLKIWTAKKAFWFCAVTAGILIAMTSAELKVLEQFNQAGDPFDPGVIRLVGLSVVTFLFLAMMFLE